MNPGRHPPISGSVSGSEGEPGPPLTVSGLGWLGSGSNPGPASLEGPSWEAPYSQAQTLDSLGCAPTLTGYDRGARPTAGRRQNGDAAISGTPLFGGVLCLRPYARTLGS